MWTLWISRNYMIFRGLVVRRVELIEKIKFTTAFWVKAKTGGGLFLWKTSCIELNG
ncbi:unnamed protein product [Camellia sinensis]